MHVTLVTNYTVKKYTSSLMIIVTHQELKPLEICFTIFMQGCDFFLTINPPHPI